MRFKQKANFFYAPYSDLRIWLIFFAVTVGIILLVQLVLLPYVFPAWHAGEGLLIGGDSRSFHRAAVEMAKRINTEGWTAWELRPYGWMPAGVAGAVYALSVPQPWTLAPLNAAVLACTALVVIKILLLFTTEKKLALMAALPFVYFPSAMLWYAQIHRDGYSNLGMLLFIYGFLLVINKEKGETAPGHLEGIGFFSALAGLIMIWLARPHQAVIYFYMGLLILAVACFYLMALFIKKRVQGKQTLAIARPGDLIITMGAGDITKAAPGIVERLLKKEEKETS